jgi:hypothetical protein
LHLSQVIIRQALSKASHSSAKPRPHAITSPTPLANAFGVDFVFYPSNTQGWNNHGLKLVNAFGVQVLTQTRF